MKRIITVVIASMVIGTMSYSLFILSREQSRLGDATRHFNNSIHVVRSYGFNDKIINEFANPVDDDYVVVVTEEDDHYLFEMTFEIAGQEKTLRSKVNK